MARSFLLSPSYLYVALRFLVAFKKNVLYYGLYISLCLVCISIMVGRLRPRMLELAIATTSSYLYIKNFFDTLYLTSYIYY